MRLKVSRSKNAASLYVTKTVYENKKQRTVTVEKLGTEKELLEKINALGLGPQGVGGLTTALAVNIETLPTHIAGLPVAVNINCHVTRHKHASL